MDKIEGMNVLKTLKNFIGIFSYKVSVQILIYNLEEVGFDQLKNKVDVDFVLEDVLQFNDVFVFEGVQEMYFPFNIFLSNFIFVYVFVFLHENGIVEAALENLPVGLVPDHPFHL